MPEDKPEIRKAAVAGVFYPANPIELGKTVAGLFAEVDKVPITGRPMAMIVPHSGYPYSGRIAARAFKLLEGEEYDNVVVISPSSTVFFKGCAVYDGNGYETPFGVVEINTTLSEKVASVNQTVYLSKMGHATGAVRGEHALEVQLPFLQVVLGRFKLVAIVMGEQEEDTAEALGQALATALANSNSLIIASSNLSHFHTQKDARKLDIAVQDAIKQYDPRLLMRTISSGKGEASGGGVIAAMLHAAKKLGGMDVKVLGYATSGETTGEIEEVVGYMSAAILGSREPIKVTTILGHDEKEVAAEQAEILTEEHKKQLKEIARNAIEAKLNDKAYQPAEIRELRAQRGIYVTILVDGKLRGIAGRVKIREPLYNAVSEMAAAAATQGMESHGLTKDDIDNLEIRVSILSPLKLVRRFAEIKIGTDGLMIRLDMHSAILLPAEASAKGWNRTAFLEQLCLKAGLPKNSYKDKSADIYKFAAEEF